MGSSRARLRGAALIAGAIWALHLLQAIERGDLDGVLIVVAGIIALITLGLVAVARRATLEDTLSSTGCFYLVVTSLAVSAVDQHVALGASLGTGIPWNALWIALFPLMVPCAPGQTLAKALIAATMTPLSFVLLVVLPGKAMPDAAQLAVLFVPVYVAALLAWGIARVLSRVGSELSRARSIGRYELVSQLGEGGHGEVWEARHRLLARPVALKLVKAPDKDNQTRVERFRREARAMARLKSPHTVDLLDFGVTEDGRLFYAMELLEGMDLEQLVRAHGPMPPARVVHILKQALASLEEAHERGMVHRDIKPANLHLGRYGLSHDHVKVLDFGLVKAATSGDANLGPPITADDRISGTPAYMAPESITGESELDGRADVYALACVAVYLLTGERVFDADDVLRAAVAHVTERPLPPSARGVTLPSGLEALIMNGLEKDPARRPDAGALRAQLEALELDRWTQDDASSWWRDWQPLPSPRMSEAPSGPTPSPRANPRGLVSLA